MLSRQQWKKIKSSLVDICKILHQKVQQGEVGEDVFKEVLAFTKQAQTFDPFQSLKGKGMFVFWATPSDEKGWYHVNVDKDGDLIYSKWRVTYNKRQKKMQLKDDNEDEEGSTHNLKRYPIKKGKSKVKPKAFDYMLPKNLLSKNELSKLPNDNKVGLTILKKI